MVKGLHRQGMKASEIVRETGLTRKRVDKWLRLDELPERHRMEMEPRPGMPAYFRKEMLRLRSEGYQNAKELLMELRKLGYVGCYSGLTRLDCCGSTGVLPRDLRSQQRRRPTPW